MAATLGINLMPQLPPDEFIACAKLVEDAGFSHMFVADSSLHARDIYPYLTLLALNTRRVTIGPLVTHPYTRHPATNLNALATVNEIAGGRGLINIGAGDRPVMELGYPMARLGVLREAIDVIRRLVVEDHVSVEGKTFSLADASIRYGRKQMPVYVTATGPRMLELAGELANGVMFFPGTDPRGVQYALDHIQIGARTSGRQLRDLYLSCCVYGSLDDDLDQARRDCLPIAAWFPQTAPAYAELIGVPAERIAAIQQGYSGGHFDDAEAVFAHVDDAMIQAFTMCGNAETWVQRLKAIEAMGVDSIVVFPLAQDKVAMIRRIAESVLPHFQRV
jgi:5,10-methylenetetrahydromethanopterin reductase